MRLAELDRLDLNDDPDEEIGIAFINDLWTGEVVPAVRPDGEHVYSEHGRELIVQREHRGRLLYARVADDASFGPWKDAPLPPSRAAGN